MHLLLALLCCISSRRPHSLSLIILYSQLVYDACVDAVFMCFLIDEEYSKKNNVPMVGGAPLKELAGFKRTDEDDKMKPLSNGPTDHM